MEQGAGGAALYHEEFVGGLPHRGQHDDRPLLGEAEDEVGHLPHPLGRGHRRPAELHHDGELRPRAPVAASLLRSGHRCILLLDNGGAGGSLAPDRRRRSRLPPARHGDRRRGPALPLPLPQPLLPGSGTVESQPRGGTESRRRRRRRRRQGPRVERRSRKRRWKAPGRSWQNGRRGRVRGGSCGRGRSALAATTGFHCWRHGPRWTIGQRGPVHDRAHLLVDESTHGGRQHQPIGRFLHSKTMLRAFSSGQRTFKRRLGT